jgi:hypothetical protein
LILNGFHAHGRRYGWIRLIGHKADRHDGRGEQFKRVDRIERTREQKANPGYNLPEIDATMRCALSARAGRHFTLSSSALSFADLAAPSRKALGRMLLHPVGKLRCSHHAGLYRNVSEVRRSDGLLVAIRRRGEAAEHGDNLNHEKVAFVAGSRTNPLSMRLAEHESEGHKEELIALIVADMQDPVTPILEVELVGEGLHDTGRTITRLSKIVHFGAAVIAIDKNFLCVGAEKIYLGHVQLPSNGTGNHEISASQVPSTARYEGQSR